MDAPEHRIDNRVAMLGAGGHGKSVINVVRPAGYVVTSVLDDDQEKWGRDLLGSPIVGPISMVVEYKQAVIAISDNQCRMQIDHHYPETKWIIAVHPGAHVYPTAAVGVGTVILPSTVVGADTSIGRHVIVSANCAVAHESHLGDYAQLSPGVQLGGGVEIGDGAFLGLGVVVLPRVTIGAGTIVGAGSVVVKDLPADCTAIGAPARPRRRR